MNSQNAVQLKQLKWRHHHTTYDVPRTTPSPKHQASEQVASSDSLKEAAGRDPGGPAAGLPSCSLSATLWVSFDGGALLSLSPTAFDVSWNVFSSLRHPVDYFGVTRPARDASLPDGTSSCVFGCRCGGHCLDDLGASLLQRKRRLLWP